MCLAMMMRAVKKLRVLYPFKTPLDAYESNEDDSYITRRYSERLAKIEEILGDLENSFIIGHSLGGIRALNMVTEIENSKENRIGIRTYRESLVLQQLFGVGK